MLALAILHFAFCILAPPAHAQNASLYLPRPEQSEPITVSADRAQHWRQGTYDVWLLEGNCRVSQDTTHVRGPQAVVWIDQPDADQPERPTLILAYFERTAGEAIALENIIADTASNAPQTGATLDRSAAFTAGAPGSATAPLTASTPLGAPPQSIPIPARVTGRIEAPDWFGRFVTNSRIDLQLPLAGTEPAEKPPIVARGFARFGPTASERIALAALPNAASAAGGIDVGWGGGPPGSLATAHVDPAVQRAQFTPPPLPIPQTVPAPVPAAPQRAGFRRIRFFPRAEGVGPSFESVQLPTGETALVLSGGVNVVIEGLTVEGLPDILGPLGDIDIETDRAVIWTAGVDPRSPADLTQQTDLPLEIYMEGNIVFRQGDRIVFADRMFYDVRRQLGQILGAELLTPLPAIGSFQYPGLVRLRAASVRQLDQSRFVAHNAFVTTSRIEEPSYHVGAETILFHDIQTPAIDPVTGLPAIDPLTGQPLFAHQRLAESQNNFLYVAGIPVFYWPTFATDLEKPTFYINNFRIRNDRVFGFQTLLEVDAFQLLGMEPVDGLDWQLNLDWLSRRGLGFGTGVDYARDDFLGILGPTLGRADAWFIHDRGRDNLGLGRRSIEPEESFRGRAFWNHRQHLVGGPLDGWIAQAEVGWISDRTFLEQYYEQEWEENKDQLTGLRFKRLFDNQSLSVEANVRLNDFFTQTQWLPRLDHYILGQPLVDDQLTWFAHTQAAYANIGIASEPTNPELAAQWDLLPWEVDSAGVRLRGRGERFVTRQEIDVPLDLAPFKVVPYALGELAHWGADVDAGDIQRAYGQLGIRASIPFWTVNPAVRDPLFNLNGLAHKVVFEVDAFWADATRDLDQFPLYDQLDDISIEEFRRRLFFAPFGGNLPGLYYFPSMAGVPSMIDPRFDPRFYAFRSNLQGWVTSPATEIADDLAAVRLGMRHRLQTKRGPFGEERIIDWLTFDSNVTWFPRDDRDNFGEPLGLADYDLRWHLGDRFSILSDGAADFFADGLRTASLGVLLTRPEIGNAYLGFRTIGGIVDANVITATLNYRMSHKWIGSASTTFDLGDAGNIGQSVHFSRIGESLIATVGGNIDASKNNVGVSFLIEPRFLPQATTRRTGILIPPAGVHGLE